MVKGGENLAKAYYGDKLSANILETPEGYLICKNVKIARTGWMDYFGHDLPASFEELPGTPVKVYRSPEEVFSDATIASFEGKPVTNTHPTEMLDVNTTPMIERGHAQNVRREGDYIVADLFIKEAGLISEIQNNLKREVSCGYECMWEQIGDHKYEQKEIIGNHIAVVRNGRAGPRVSIQDEKPKGGTIKNMKMSKRVLAAIGFKHFAQDAEPEEIAAAIDEMSEDKPDKETPAVKDEGEDLEKEKEKKASMDALERKIDSLTNIVNKLVESDKEVHAKFGAKDVMDDLEEELKGEASDEDHDEEKETKKDEVKESKSEQEKEDKEGTEKHKFADDSVLTKFVKDMKPAIMQIKDEATRNEVAKAFVKSVRDARNEAGPSSSYSSILSTINKNRQKAVTDAANKRDMSQAAEIACNKWAERGKEMIGGNK